MHEIYENTELGLLLEKYNNKKSTPDENSKLIENLLLEPMIDASFINRISNVCNLDASISLLSDSIMMVLLKNQKVLKMSEKKITKLLNKANLNYQNQRRETPMIVLLKQNLDGNTKFSDKELLFFLNKTDINIKENNGCTAMYYLLLKSDFQSKEEVIKLWNQNNEKNQEETFKELNRTYVSPEYHNDVEKAIYFLLYDCQYQPSEESKIWLKNMKLFNIIQMIEKRDIFFNLEKDLVTEKISTKNRKI
jgi:hypothetical protein